MVQNLPLPFLLLKESPMYNQLKNITILLAEDEKKLALSMKVAMGEYFYQFVVVHNGEDAIKAYYRHRPDILITDILMPKLTGLELMQQLRVIDKKLPIIILSAHSDSEKLLQAIDFGVTKYFIKPFDPDELLDYITTITAIKEEEIQLKDNFCFNTIKKELYFEKEPIKLTTREIDLLSFLLGQKEFMADNREIKILLWGEEVSNERLRTFIKRLRKKTSKELIFNSSGRGYGIAATASL